MTCDDATGDRTERLILKRKKNNYGIYRYAREKKCTSTFAHSRVLMNLSVGMLRSHSLLVRASPMDCQPPRQKLRRNTPTHPPLCNPYAADSPLCGTDADPHRRVFHSFATRESLRLLSRLRKTRTATRAMPVVDTHAVFTIVSRNGYHARH